MPRDERGERQSGEAERPVAEDVVPQDGSDVDVAHRVDDRPAVKLSEYIRSLPSGTRTKEDIDRQVRGERDSWS
jgi:hypothetical protein